MKPMVTTLMEHLLSATVLLAVVIALRAMLVRRLPKRAFVALWYVCLAKLFIFAEVESGVSVYNLLHSDGGVSSGLRTAYAAENAAAGGAFTDAAGIFLPVWLAGALIIAVRLFGGHLRAVRKYREALPFERPWLEKWHTSHPLLRPLRIRRTDLVGSACTYGLFRPIILLPRSADDNSREELEYMLEHEYAHIRSFDILFKWLMAAALCIYWYHPLVWAMYFLSGRDLEFACDEAVVGRMGRERRKDYARLLIRLEERKLAPLTLSTGFGQNHVTERIEFIMKMKKTSMIGIAAAAILVVGVTAVFATSANASKDDADQEKTADSYVTESSVTTKDTEEKASGDASDMENDSKCYVSEDGSGKITVRLEDGSTLVNETAPGYKAELNEEKSGDGNVTVTVKDVETSEPVLEIETEEEAELVEGLRDGAVEEKAE